MTSSTTLADGTTLARWGAPPTSRRHLGRPRRRPAAGEGAAFRVLERLDNGALANYEFSVARCECPRTLTLRAPRAFDRTFTCEEIGAAATRLLEVRTYPDRPRPLLARLFAADLDRLPAEDAIRDELERLGALLGEGRHHFAAPRSPASAADRAVDLLHLLRDLRHLLDERELLLEAAE